MIIRIIIAISLLFISTPIIATKSGIDDYAVAWIAFIKGLIIGSLITYYMNF